MRRIAAALMSLALCGCVDRLVSLRSQPPGARVFLDGAEVGATPMDVRYSWYGTRDLMLVRHGYVTVRQPLELRPPWYQIFPIDFIFDILLPFTITDRTEVEVVMREDLPESRPRDWVKARAEELRKRLGPP